MAATPPAPAPPRVLLAGDPHGRLHQLFKRVKSVNQSTGPFHALLCVGQFFSPEADAEGAPGDVADYLEGRAAVPIPTYFTGDYGPTAPRLLSKAAAGARGFAPGGIEICPNLFWLRGSNRFTLHGLSVVYLSGKKGPGGPGCYSQDDVDALRALAEEPGIVDLFLTNEWPTGVVNGADTSNVPNQVLDPHGYDPVVAELVAEIKPRYHIAGTKGVFYSREPYVNDSAAHVTRFIGLANVGNKEKQKFIHAISPTPASAMSSADIHAKPPNSTLSPYAAPAQSIPIEEAPKRPADNTDAQYWRYDVKRQRQGEAEGGRLCFKFTSSGSCPRGSKCNFRHDEEAVEHYHRNVCFDFLNKGKCERGPECKFAHSLSGDTSIRDSRPRRRVESSCWFCLSSPDVESHLVISIGEAYYCALAKGPLVPNHVLMIPVEHCPSTLMMPSEAEVELARYKNALCKYFEKQGKTTVFFEWVSQNSRHANLQVVPVPFPKADAVDKIFHLAAKKLGFEFSVVNPDGGAKVARESLISQSESKSSLFYVELPEGKILLHNIDSNEKFPAQFGREVLAGLLSMADRADWRNCKLSKEEEIQMVDDFKQDFREFDPAE
ncbi:zinc finger CCCH domain-containing protein 59 [Panicum miliaceum]|uniref:Zinc finger CCCH domain-containing protein 59 n=1 Tax=Panicum miliaceum TaxID=4540 RepID=A0A3L6T9M1_PANMI|nr:zinc finger CCCH domain-containing protein 59 [Panicum miliaceum]